MKQLYANNAKTTLAVDITPSSTTIVVSDGSRFPSPSVSTEYFEVTLELGSVIEIVRIASRVGNTLTVAENGRGIDGTIPSTFGSGSQVECRVSSGMLSRFSTGFYQGAAIEQLTSPAKSLVSGYVCTTLDTAGNPVIVLGRDGSTWRAINYTVIGAANATSGTTTSVVLPGVGASSVATGKYIVQFTSGANTGLLRLVTSATYAGGNGTLNWTVALPNAVSAGDTVELWKDNASFLTSPKLSSGVPVSSLINPAVSDTNVYICSDKDDFGNDVVAQSSDTKWSFISHYRRVVSGQVQAGSTTTQIVSTAIGNVLGSGAYPTAKYIIQFTSGTYSGMCRVISSSAPNTSSWVSALPTAPANGVTFEIYQSNASVFSSIDSISDEALVNAIVFSG